MPGLAFPPPEDRPACLGELLAGPPWGPTAGPARRRHHTRQGAVLTVEIQSDPVTFAGRRGTLTLARDVTEREHLRTALDTTGAQLREAQSVAKVGIWEWDIANDKVRWSDELYRIFGLTPQIFPGTFEGYMAVVHPEDRSLVEATIERSLRNLEPFDFAHRSVLPDGTTRWLQCRGRVRSVDGRPVRTRGRPPAARPRAPPRRRRVRRAVRGPRGRPGRRPGGRTGAGRPRPPRPVRRPRRRLLGQHRHRPHPAVRSDARRPPARRRHGHVPGQGHGPAPHRGARPLRPAADPGPHPDRPGAPPGGRIRPAPGRVPAHRPP